MKKNISIILVFTLIISMCSGALCADEAAFEEAEVYEGDAVHVETVYEGDVSHVETVYEGDAAHIETVFEDPSNRDEEEYVTADSVVFTEEYVTGDSSLADESDYVWDDMSGEAVSPDDVSSSYEDDELLSDDSVLSEEEVISEDTITDDSSFENVTASGTCGDNLTWVLTGEEGDLTLTVSGSGEMENFEGAPWYEYRSGIFRVILSDGVTSIGTGAFYDCCNLVSITIPDSVTGIGESAFVNCCNLNNITIPGSVTVIGDHAFSECKGLTGITIPNSIISIGAGAFSDTGLTGFTIPDSVTSIGNHAFGKCAGLQGINVSGDNPAYSSYDGVLFDKNGTILICCPGGKQGEYIIPDHVTGIGDYAFSDCESLSSIIIPNSVTSIGDNAFSNCRSLTGITIPDSVKWTGKYMFSECESLTSITISNRAVSIGDGTFSGCKSLTSITIPDSVTIIGDLVFWNCESLTSVTISNSVTNIADMTFWCCNNLKSITIPNSVTSIGDYAFIECDNLTIYGKSGSYAETYAKEKGIPFVSISKKKISKITPDKSEYTIFAGDTAVIKATVSPSDASDKTLNYKSSNTSIAKVNSSGKITAASAGTATITISANDGSGVKASCKVNVCKKPTAKLNATKKTIYTKGKPHTFILMPTVFDGELVSVSYSSSDLKKAYVEKSGKVTAKGAGTATITATVKMKNAGGNVTKKLTCEVAVKKPTLSVSPTSMSLKKRQTKTLTVKATPAGTVSYSSSDTKIATVNSKGKITAKKNGSCKITVKCNGITNTVKVTVQ